MSLVSLLTKTMLSSFLISENWDAMDVQAQSPISQLYTQESALSHQLDGQIQHLTAACLKCIARQIHGMHPQWAQPACQAHSPGMQGQKAMTHLTD